MKEISPKQVLLSRLVTILIIFLSTRLLLLLWVWAVRQIFNQPFSPDPVLRPYMGVALERNLWLEPWQRWDTLHYQAIAQSGYSAFDSALFVPPLFPGLMRGFAHFIGGNTLLSGIIISNFAFLIALIFLYMLGLREFRDEKSAIRSVVYLIVFPTAFFFMAAYTESIYIMFAVLTIYCLQSKRWVLAGLAGGMTTLTRLPGLIILFPIAYAAWIEKEPQQKILAWSAVVLAGLGGLIFPIYVWVMFGYPPWTPWLIQTARSQGGLAFPGFNLLQAFVHVFSGKAFPSDVFDILFLLVFMACAIPVWRYLPKVYSVYYLVLVAFYLSRSSGIQPLLSTSRYVLALFPAFMVFGKWGDNRLFNRVFLYLSLFGLLYMSAQFALWGWVG